MDPDALLSALKNRKLKTVAPPPEIVLVADDFSTPVISGKSTESTVTPACDVPENASRSVVPSPVSAESVVVSSIENDGSSTGNQPVDSGAPDAPAPVFVPTVEEVTEKPEPCSTNSILDQLRRINNGASAPIKVNTSPISGLGLSQKAGSSAAKSRRKGRELDRCDLDDDVASQNSEPNVFVSSAFLSSGADFHTSSVYSSSPARCRSPSGLRRSTNSGAAGSGNGRSRPQNRAIVQEICELRECNTSSLYDIDSEIINNPNYSLDSLRRAGYSAQLLHKCGRFTAYAMRNDGNFTAKELLDSGCYLLTECKRVGYSAVEIKEVGLPLSALLLVGYDLAELLDAGYSLRELRENKVKVANLRVLSTVHVRDLIDAGYSGVELRCAGYTATELVHFYGHVVVNTVGDVSDDDSDEGGDSVGGVRQRAGGVSYVSVEKSSENLRYLTDSGFNARELKDAGYTARELKSVGFTYSHVRGLGFSVQELVSSGYHQEIERQVLVELYTVTNGATWIHSFNWCTEGTELKDWYGITVEPFSNRVIRISLNNNNLTGTLPNSLSLLLSCQSLAFQNNYLDFDAKVVSNFTLSANGRASVIKSPVNSPVRSVFGVPSPVQPVFNKAVLNMLQLPQLQYINLQYNYEQGITVAMHATHTSFDNQYHFELTTPFAIREFVEEVKAKLQEVNTGAVTLGDADSVSLVSGRNSTNSARYGVSGMVKPKSPGSVAGSALAPSVANDADDKQQKDALVALFYATNGHNWKNKQNWCKMHIPLNQWFGVTTNSLNYVTKIDLAYNNLKGTIPNEFFYLLSDFHDMYATKFSYLSVLDLRYNSIHGPISTNIISLRESLKELHLHSNRFGGNAFEWLPQLPELVHVDIKNNQFKDHLTEVELKMLSSLKCLTHLNATSNLLEYSIALPGNKKGQLPMKPIVNKAKMVNTYVKGVLPWCNIVVMLK